MGTKNFKNYILILAIVTGIAWLYHPTLNYSIQVCFAHGGGAYPYLVGRMQRGYDCRPDLCATDTDIPPNQQLGSFYTDSLVHDHKALKFLVDVVGKVLLLDQTRSCEVGSDQLVLSKIVA